MYNLHADKQKEEKFKREVTDRYIDNLVIHLKDSFADVELLEAFQLFEPPEIPTEESEELYGHGFLQLQTLFLKYYSKGCGKSEPTARHFDLSGPVPHILCIQPSFNLSDIHKIYQTMFCKTGCFHTTDYSPSLVDSKTAEKERSHLFLGEIIGSVLSSLTSNSVLLETYPEFYM